MDFFKNRIGIEHPYVDLFYFGEYVFLGDVREHSTRRRRIQQWLCSHQLTLLAVFDDVPPRFHDSAFQRISSLVILAS